MAGRSWFGHWRQVSRFNDDARLYSGTSSEAVESSGGSGRSVSADCVIGRSVDQSVSDCYFDSGTDIDVRAQGVSGGCASLHSTAVAYSDVDGFHGWDD